MKPSIYRRIRRRATHDTAVNKKENKQEQSFFTNPAGESFFHPAPVVQRKCEKCEEEDKKVQRVTDKKEEEKLQKKEDLSSKTEAKEEEKKDEKLMKKEDKKEEEHKLQKKDAGTANAAPVTSSYINSLNGRGTVLPVPAQQFFGERMGYDFSNVKVHTDKEAQQSAKEVNAKAYTVGNNIVFNEGQFNTESTEGKKLIAHELVHVVQQEGDKKEKISRRGGAGAAPTTVPYRYQPPPRQVYGTGGPITVEGANPQTPYAYNNQDDSWEAMIYRSNKVDARQRKLNELERPVLSVISGGAAPDFITQKDMWGTYQASDIGKIQYRQRSFHIIDKIIFDFNQADTDTALASTFTKYKNWLIINESKDFCSVHDLGLDPSLYWQYSMFQIPQNLPVGIIRQQIINSYQSRLKVISELKTAMEYKKALKEAEDFILQGKRRQKGECSFRSIPRKGGNEAHDRFAEYVALIKGAFLTAASETEVVTPEGISYSFDVLNPQNRHGYEVKTSHQWAGDLNIAGTMYWDGFIKRAMDLEAQRMKGLYVANRCGLGFSYVFDTCTAMLGMKKQWSNIPPVEYIPYPGKPKEKCL